MPFTKHVTYSALGGTVWWPRCVLSLPPACPVNANWVFSWVNGEGQFFLMGSSANKVKELPGQHPSDPSITTVPTFLLGHLYLSRTLCSPHCFYIQQGFLHPLPTQPRLTTSLGPPGFFSWAPEERMDRLELCDYWVNTWKCPCSQIILLCSFLNRKNPPIHVTDYCKE
jgi:hypothetical protein